jgi:hypothetical protein
VIDGEVVDEVGDGGINVLVGGRVVDVTVSGIWVVVGRIEITTGVSVGVIRSEVAFTGPCILGFGVSGPPSDLPLQPDTIMVIRMIRINRVIRGTFTIAKFPPETAIQVC